MAGEFRMSHGPAGVDTEHGPLTIIVDTLEVFALLQIMIIVLSCPSALSASYNMHVSPYVLRVQPSAHIFEAGRDNSGCPFSGGLTSSRREASKLPVGVRQK